MDAVAGGAVPHWAMRPYETKPVFARIISSIVLARPLVLRDGKYSVWFKTPVGEGAGVVDFCPNGDLIGGDTSFSYTGNWERDGDRFKANLSAKRIAAGPPGVFGMDEIDITVAGYSDGGVTASCTGFAKQTPGLKLEVTLIRMGD